MTEDRFANQKAISSDDYFGRKQEQDPEVAARLSKFAGSSSISRYCEECGVEGFFFSPLLCVCSAEFYDRDEGIAPSGGGGGIGTADELAQNIAATAKEDLEKLTQTVTEGIQSIAALGSAFFSSMQDPNRTYSSGGGW